MLAPSASRSPTRVRLRVRCVCVCISHCVRVRPQLSEWQFGDYDVQPRTHPEFHSITVLGHGRPATAMERLLETTQKLLDVGQGGGGKFGGAVLSHGDVGLGLSRCGETNGCPHTIARHIHEIEATWGYARKGSNPGLALRSDWSSVLGLYSAVL